MKSTYLRFGTTALVLLFGTVVVSGQDLTNLSALSLNDLSAFKNPGSSWTVAGSVTANLNAANELTLVKGPGILTNSPGKKGHGNDLFTNAVHGDMILELDYLMAKGSNSGIYLQGNYEFQLLDSWTATNPLSSDNGGIYERWDDSKPEGQQGFGGYAPRQNASKAPGLWQHLKIAFQAPQFDAAGNKTANARILSAELNGVLIHDNVELFGPTRGAADKEKALGALRFQGDHGAVAFKNIKITALPKELRNGGQKGGGGADPIYIDAPVNTMIRSFVDISPGTRVVHAISVGSPQKVHYSYDLDKGLLVYGWRGDFVDATPMWDGRGNGTSRPRGARTAFTATLQPALARLETTQAAWPLDTTGTGFKPRGYVMDNEDRPEFKYNLHGLQVTDAIKALENGEGLSREISLDKPAANIYLLLASGTDIQELGKGIYLIDGQSWYLKFSGPQDKPLIREADGKKELIIQLRGKLNYSILF